MSVTHHQTGADWKFGLFGCFGDAKLCLLTFFVPCYSIGKNSASLGEDCLIHGLLPLVGLNFGPVVRWRMRQERGIAGSMLNDVVLHSFCPCCALVQEAREIGWSADEVTVGGESSDSDGGARNNAQEIYRE